MRRLREAKIGPPRIIMVPYPFAKPSLARKIILGYSIVVGLAMASGGYAIYNFSVLNNITRTVLQRDRLFT